MSVIDEFTTPDITFLGEQDGPAERRLKEALGVLLWLDRSVIRAYLARVRHDGKTESVMLALLTDGEDDSVRLVAQAGKIFAALHQGKSRHHLSERGEGRRNQESLPAVLCAQALYGTLNCFLHDAPITSMPLVPSRSVISRAV